MIQPMDPELQWYMAAQELSDTEQESWLFLGSGFIPLYFFLRLLVTGLVQEIKCFVLGKLIQSGCGAHFGQSNN